MIVTLKKLEHFTMPNTPTRFVQALTAQTFKHSMGEGALSCTHSANLVLRFSFAFGQGANAELNRRTVRGSRTVAAVMSFQSVDSQGPGDRVFGMASILHHYTIHFIGSDFR